MAISFFLIAVAVLLFGAFGVCVLIAIVTKRLAIAVVGGLAILLLVGLAFSLLLVVRTDVHSPTATLMHGMNTHPDRLIISPPSVPAPHFAPIGDESTTHFRFGVIGLFPLLVIAAIIGFIVALVSRSHHSPERRRHGWPALLAMPVGALACFLILFGMKVSHRSQHVVIPPGEAIVQDWGRNFDVEEAFQAEVARAQRETERLKARMAKVQKASAKSQETRVEAERRAVELGAKLQRQFATMDINELIELFQAPKIELAEAEQPLPAGGSSPPPAAVAATSPSPPAAPEVSPDSAPTKDPADSQVKTATDEKSSRVAVEAEPAEATLAVAQANASEAKPLPSWVDDQPGMDGQDWLEVVVTDEYATAEECRQAMDVYLMLKTAERIQTLAGHGYVDHSRPSLTFERNVILADGHTIVVRGEPVFPGDDRLRLLRKMGIGIDEIRRSVVREEHLASRHSSRAFDTMYRQYTLAQFTPWFDTQLRRHWDSYQRQERFAFVGGGAAAVLGLLGFVFGLLKIDTWTKGYYSKRLFIGVPAAIIVGGFMLAIILDLVIGI